MERKTKLRDAIEQVKSNVQAVTEDVKGTVEELKETVPRPLRNRVQKRVDDILSGRGRRRGRRG